MNSTLIDQDVVLPKGHPGEGDPVYIARRTSLSALVASCAQTLGTVAFLRKNDPEGAFEQAHLPTDHGVEADLLREVAARCALTGGQIRNAVLHAALLAASNGQVIRTDYVEEAVRREYRKSGAACPLRPADPTA